MKTIDSYIIEKLHLTKDNKNLVTKDIDVSDFIDSVEGDYQKRVVKLLANVIAHKKENPGSTCFIVKSTLKRDGVELPQYKWAESKNGKTLNIGDKTPAGSIVVYEVTNKTKIPSYWSSLYLDEGLVSEKLHLTKDNKDLHNLSDVENFIESFDNQKLKEHLANLIYNCVKHVHQSYYRNENHKCYIVRMLDRSTYANEDENTISLYKWSQNRHNEDFKVGDTNALGSKILFVVTRDTKFPEIYKKYTR